MRNAAKKLKVYIKNVWIKKSNSICISHAVDSGIFNLPGRSVYHFIVLFLYKSLHVEGAGMGGIG